MLARRSIIKGVAGLPLAAVLASPTLARAAAAGVRDVSITTAGGKTVAGALTVPDASPAPAVLLVHEWWGLNDQIKVMAGEFAKQGYLALAVDLYDGRVGATAEQARAYMQDVKALEAVDTLVSWSGWLKGHDQGNGKLGTVGWCFGGGWSLMTGISTPVDATVVYYGNVRRTAAELATLNGPVLGHFATLDQWINKAMVSGFEAAMAQAGKRYATHWYEANHAFANPTQSRYDEADAKLAWQRTLAFFDEHLKG